MEVEPPMISGTISPSLHQPLPQNTQQTPPENLELNTEQIKKILAFGKDLQGLYNNLTAQTPNERFKVLLQVLFSVSMVLIWSCHGMYLLQDSFSLLAYTDPRSSPVGYLLDPLQREPVCAALNSAILGMCTSCYTLLLVTVVTVVSCSQSLCVYLVNPPWSLPWDRQRSVSSSCLAVVWGRLPSLVCKTL